MATTRPHPKPAPALSVLPAPYRLLTPSRTWQGAILVQLLQAAYRELNPTLDLSHLQQTVEQFYNPERTPLWLLHYSEQVVGGVWLGNAKDQRTGSAIAYLFLVYIHPDHRRQGLASHLLTLATDWAHIHDYEQLQLQVFSDNLPALAFYQKLGFATQGYVLSKAI